MKSKEFGPISSGLAANLFNKSTMDTLKRFAKSITKVDIIEELPKEEYLIALIKFTVSRELELLLSDYGIEKVSSEWADFIENNNEALIDNANSELPALKAKLITILSKFLKEQNSEE